jgi:hypothetical protein
MFIETFVDNPKEYNFADRPGYYRFELVERTLERCAFYDSVGVKYPIRFANYKMPEGYCLSVESIEKPSAEYSVELRAQNLHISNTMGIVADYAYIRRLFDNKVLAKATRFTHLGGWFQRSLSNVLSGGVGEYCPAELSHGFRYELMVLTFE